MARLRATNVSCEKFGKKMAEDADRAEWERNNPVHDQPAPKYRERFYTPTRIKSDLDWTDKLIKQYLGEPDEFAPNPRYTKAGAPMRLYRTTRIAAVEATPEFQAAFRASQDRKLSARSAVATRVRNMEDVMREAKITITPNLTNEQIHDLAFSTHGGNYAGDPGYFNWSNRTAINCIRHNLTNYEELWKACNRGETGQGAYEILRERVDAVIRVTYPQFFDEP